MARYWRLAFWLCAVAVLVFSLLPATPELPTTGWDKSNHLLAFATLTILGLLGYPASRATILVGLVFYGGIIELLQSLTPYRFAEWGDLLADAIGVLVGGLGFYILVGRMSARTTNSARP